MVKWMRLCFFSFLFILTTPILASDLLLRVKEKVSLESLAQNVIDPTSSRFGKFYSPDELKILVGPTDQEYNTLLGNLKTRGYTLISEDHLRIFLTIRANPKPASTPAPAPTGPTPPAPAKPAFEAFDALPELANNLVENITDPDNGRRSYPRYMLGSAFSFKRPTTPQEIQTLYGFNPIYASGIMGNGQHIAVATYGGFTMSDINEYYSKVNLPRMPIVDQVIVDGTPILDLDAAVETEVDAEFTGHMAPGAQIHIFASSLNNDLGEVHNFNAILDDNRSKVVNYSWGDCEKNVSLPHKTDMDKIFARAVAQGVNIFIASGDDGASGCKDSSLIVADWPSANPYVIGVGGTSLGQGTSLVEKAWPHSGGGVSSFYKVPEWQSGYSSTFVRRGFPDVAFNADAKSGQAAWVTYQPDPKTPPTKVWMGIGGTSIASPQWAGYLALVNEARSSKGPLGYLNPVLYAMPLSERVQNFNDITIGDNGAYRAGVGWDPVTGWGSMRADQLLSYLVQSP